MERVCIKKAKILAGRTRPRRTHPLETAETESELLRDAVFHALSTLSMEERTAFRERLFGELRDTGLRIRNCLFMLGVSATLAEDITAPEIAALIRYVRLVEPRAMKSVVETLRELLIGANSTAGMQDRGPACVSLAESAPPDPGREFRSLPLHEVVHREFSH